MNSKHNAIKRARSTGISATILAILLAIFVTGSALAVENRLMIGIDGVSNNIGEDDDLVSPFECISAKCPLINGSCYLSN